LPSGVKYMLYGSSTGIALPGLPVFGSIGIRLPSLRPSAVFATQSVFMSHDGTMWCGLMPTLNLSTTCSVAGSMTHTSFDFTCGTYTRSRSLATAGSTLPATCSL
jgi:hypothetical protein